MLESRQGDFGRIEILRIRPETNRRAGVGFANRADYFKLAAFLAAGEAHVVFLAATANPDSRDFWITRLRPKHQRRAGRPSTGSCRD